MIDRADLDRRIADLTAEYDAAGAGRGPLACRCGRLLLVRHLAPGDGPVVADDRDRAIALFEEALAGDLVADDRTAAQLGAGLLLMTRVMPVPDLGAGDPAALNLGSMLGLLGGRQPEPGPAAGADLARAIAHLEQLGDVPAEIEQVSAMMLVSLRLLQATMHPGDSGLDVLTVLGQLQELTARMPAGEPLRSPAQLLLAIFGDESGGPVTPEAVDGTRDLLAQLPDGSSESAVVRDQLAVLLGRAGQETGSVEDLAEARSLLEESLARLGAGDPGRPAALRKLAGVVVSDAALRGDPAAVDRAVDLAEQVGALPAEDAVTTGKDHFLRAMALTLRGHRDAQPEDVRAAAEHLRLALDLVPVEDPLAPSIIGLLGALLNDRHLAGGVIEDAGAARFRLAQARQVLDRHAAAGTLLGGGDVHTIVALDALGRTAAAIRLGDRAELDHAIDDLRAALELLPPEYPWRSRFGGSLGLALLARAAADNDHDGILAAAALVEQATATMAVEPSGRPVVVALSGVAVLVRGLLDGDESALERADELFAEAAAADIFGVDQRIGIYAVRALGQLARHERGKDPGVLDEAVTFLERARQLLGDRPGNALTASVLARLGDAYWIRATDDDRVRAVHAGLAALRARVGDTLLQTEVADALIIARGAADEAARVADRCLDVGRVDLAAEALELGRGLVLHAATSAGRVPKLLRAAGYDDLAAEWAGEQARPGATVAGLTTAELAQVTGQFLGGEAPSDLRRRVLAALAEALGSEHLLAAPSAGEIAGALTEVGADALVYLTPGRLLVIRSDGSATVCPAAGLGAAPLAAVAAVGGPAREADATLPSGRAANLRELCEWAWRAAVQPLLDHVGPWQLDHPPRLVLIPGGALGSVPWHAARRPGPGAHYACASLVLSYAASARQLVDGAGRLALPTAADQVLFADPAGDLPGARTEVETLRRHVYPGAAVLSPAATPAQLLEQLPGADVLGTSLLHLSCHGHVGAGAASSYLQLATRRLTVTTILEHAHGRPPDTPGPLVVLASCSSDLSPDDFDEALTLATAFQAAGAAGVVGSRWAVTDRTTRYLMVMFHVFLQVDGLAPADALRAAQLWMLDPGRRAPAAVPALLDDLDDPDELTAVAAWGAFSHHGR